jgi:cytochrome bd-type quinol oxidase subunit 2
VEDQLTYHPETIATALEDSTAYTVQALITTMAAICSVLFALTADSKEGSTWPLFLIVCFTVFYSAFSLSMSVFPACVDALIVSAAINPERFAKENQLVLLRFFRTSEIEMR